ncbi:MAG: type II toxin-antitoxin system RelE/ParE family toxin [Candidatus Aminicenantes bacterium]|nr:type II toxin-antitoxin system RelE/ParE family toxin [Candidatus Aminicenantes bacterium]
MFEVRIDELVLKKDFKKIDKADQLRIINTIRKKLTSKPQEFGKPLKGELKGYWKLRIGEYRVIYEIEKDKIIVYVIMVGYRRDKEAYNKAIIRLGLK